MMTAKRDLAVDDAVDRWLGSLQTERTQETLSAYHYRLKLFAEWCEEHDEIETMQDLDGWLLDSFETERKSIAQLNTIKNELTTLKQFLEYCEGINVVDDGLSEAIEPPTIPKREQSSSVKLSADAATALLTHYRDGTGTYGCRAHALLEICWHTGARLGGIRALDVADLRETQGGDHYLVFQNREETETRLKKGQRGERPVILNETVAGAIEAYIEDYRLDKTDDYGRSPLITSTHGRPTKGAIRQWIYAATVPCQHSPCPHDRVAQSCEYLEHNRESGCPSSRSPHQIRTGAITWMRDQGISEEQVAERVNASVETIREHYDKQDPIDEMLNRRADDLRGLDIDQRGEQNGQ